MLLLIREGKYVFVRSVVGEGRDTMLEEGMGKYGLLAGPVFIVPGQSISWIFSGQF